MSEEVYLLDPIVPWDRIALSRKPQLVRGMAAALLAAGPDPSPEFIDVWKSALPAVLEIAYWQEPDRQGLDLITAPPPSVIQLHASRG